MPEPVQNLKPETTPNIVRIKGRIRNSRVYDGTNIYIVTIPSKDEFSSPSAVEVRSKSSLGSQGMDIDVQGELRGFARNWLDKNGTQQTSVSSHIFI